MADTLTTLSTILSNDLLHSIAPYLHPRDISALSLTSSHIHTQLSATPSINRHTDLAAQKPHKPDDIRRFLRCERLLSATRTLVLDDILVTLPQLGEILASSAITILSLLACKGIHERELIAYLTDPHSAKPKGIYWFTDPAITASGSRFVEKPHAKLSLEGAAAIAALPDLCFDTRVCRGARHGEEARIAEVALRGRCAGCDVAPANPLGLEAVLVAPAPLHSSTVKAACKGADGRTLPDCLRCEDCVRERWCEGCGKWWCESCAANKVIFPYVTSHSCRGANLE
jgi:hypothetical protein